MQLSKDNLTQTENIACENTPFKDRVSHGYADSNGVKIHYATLGQGPLVLMLHGFPDHWYTWRYQMESLSHHYQVVAMDLRGYNLSDKPKGAENYGMQKLVADVLNVISQLGHEQAILVGHDWGGALAWQCAINAPAIIQKLIILNSPHPRGLSRELVSNPQQQQISQYARTFNSKDAYKQLSPEILGTLLEESSSLSEDYKEKSLEAFEKSDIEAMLHYYQMNYPQEPYEEDLSPVVKVKAPVLIIYGLQDKYFVADTLNNTWEWLEKDLTLTVLSEAGHFVQHDAPKKVTQAIQRWLSS